MLNLPVCLQKRGRALVIFNEKYVQYRVFTWQFIPLSMYVLSSQVEDTKPRTQKKTSEAKAKDCPFEDRSSRGQGQERSRQAFASVLPKKKGLRRSSKFFFKRSQKKKVFKTIFQAKDALKDSTSDIPSLSN